MDPVSTALVVKKAHDLVLSPIQEILKDKLKETALAKALKSATAYRTEVFLSQLAMELGGPDPDRNLKIDDLIDKITKSEGRLEVLADAQKKVAFSVSKNLGPRIAAMIVAPLLQSGEIASESQEIMLHTATIVSDVDLVWFKTHFLNARPAPEGYVVLFHEHRKMPMPLSVIRLVGCGLVYTGSPYMLSEVLESASSIDGGDASYADDIFVYALASMGELVDLISRAQGPAS